MAIRSIVRQTIIEDLLAKGNIYGNMSVSEFVRKVFPKTNEMPTKDTRFGMKTLVEEIHQHMDLNYDWDSQYLYFQRLDLLSVDDGDFLYFLEQFVNPAIRRFDVDDDLNKIPIDNCVYVEIINRYLSGEGYELKETESIGGLPVYKAINIAPGVEGTVQNIIFAALYKPEIAFDDALNNRIRITRNADQCLIYDRPIPNNGVCWNELVEWYSEKYGIVDDKEIAFCNRISGCLGSPVEKTFMNGYYLLAKQHNGNVPALIPQVYLYYDPLTIKQRGYKLFEHQKMDFLMIFSHRNRVVIEIDGKQHYSENNEPSPRLYAEMVKAQREMSLFGYDVYRFGGYELSGVSDDLSRKNEVYEMIRYFFCRLFEKYDIQI